MKLGTTPKHTIVLPFEISLVKELKITYAQNKHVILEKYLRDCSTEDDNTVSFYLSQEETFLFIDGVNVEVQVRVLTINDDVLASDIQLISASRCLDREVLE